MNRLRNSAITLIIHLAIFFNIERLDWGQQNVINIHFSVYLLVLAVILLMMFVKRLNQLSTSILFILSSVVFLGVKLLFINTRPILGDIYTYLTITELAMFIIAVILTREFANNIFEVEDLVANISFSKFSRVKQISEASSEIQAEVYRSRRFQRPLSVVVFEQEVAQTVKPNGQLVTLAQNSMIKRYMAVSIVRELSRILRQTDLLLELDGNHDSRFVILSPETDQKGVATVLDRVQEVAKKLEIKINFGVASFPEDALTFDALLRKAELNLDLQDMNLYKTQQAGVNVEPVVFHKIKEER